MKYEQDKPEGPRAKPRRFSAFRIAAFRVAERLCALGGGRSFYRRRHLESGRFLVREELVLIPGLPAALCGLRVAQLSDLHAGPFLAAGDLRAVIERVNAEAVDLVVITGDFISHEWDDALLVLEDLARLEAPLGTWAVFGNHDYKEREEWRIAEAYAARGIRFLRNESTHFERGGCQLALMGLEDLEEGRKVDLQAAREAIPEDAWEIALCHNPMGAPALVRPRCMAILSGHTHGTQVDLPWLRRLGPQHPGLRVDFAGTTLLVSRGIGVVGIPLRIGAPAEIVIIRFEAKPPTAAAPQSDKP